MHIRHIGAEGRRGRWRCAATAFLGLLLIGLGLLFGNMALPLRAVIPFGTYGTLLAYVGWEHLRLGLRVTDRRHLGIVLMMGTLYFVPGSNLAYAALGGIIAHYGARGILRLQRRGPSPKTAQEVRRA